MRKRILVIDIGGSNVKLLISSRTKRRKFESGPSLTPRRFVIEATKMAADWEYNAIAIGFPAPVVQGKIAAEPKNLGKGWVGFDFRKAFGKPVRIMNDAAMQALGSYRGGRMLFVGLGTGLGSALVWERNVLSLELSDLPYIENQTVEDHLSDAALERVGSKNWEREVLRVVTGFKQAFIADYVVLGGGNAKRIEDLPDGVELGHNRNALAGGQRLWQRHGLSRKPAWNIV
jgi:predicted NBD/HSP70 family sugar kinase